MDAPAVLAHLEKVLQSRTFCRSQKLKRFLSFIVSKTQKGEAAQIKEYTIGVEIYGRGKDFDPRLDPIVRMEAGRLRSKLAQYYAADGRRDTVRFELTPGSYVPGLHAPGEAEEDSTAGTLCAKGVQLWSQWNEDSVRKAMGCYRTVLRANPGSARAMVGLSECSLTLAFWDISTTEHWKKAHESVANAVRLDPGLPEARIALAALKSFYSTGEFDTPVADLMFAQALRERPDYAVGHILHAAYLLGSGRIEESLQAALTANSLGTGSLAAKGMIVVARYYRRDYEWVADACLKAISLDPTAAPLYHFAARALLGLGQMKRALAVLKDGLELDRRDGRLLGVLGYALASTGRRKAAQKILADLADSRGKTRYSVPMALILLGLNDSARMFFYLRKAAREKSAQLYLLPIDPLFDSIRGDVRYAGIKPQGLESAEAR